MTELINAAGVCKTSIAEYYQSKGAFPAGTADSGCPTVGTANSGAPTVAAFGVDLGRRDWRTQHPARRQCERRDPRLHTDDGGCGRRDHGMGDCKAGTDIAAKHLPAVCRY